MLKQISNNELVTGADTFFPKLLVRFRSREACNPKFQDKWPKSLIKLLDKNNI